MIDETIDGWMEQTMGQIHGSVLPAQDLVMIDEGEGKVLLKTEVQVPRKKGASWTRMTFQIDLERAFNGLVKHKGTEAKLYALFCIGVEPMELAEEAHLRWSDAPKSEYEMHKVVLRMRAEWDKRLQKIGIFASDNFEETQ
tara:strand:- start:1156 stop:1578 length:423 start_codon:yes stop_codon:yes gene_type:complete